MSGLPKGWASATFGDVTASVSNGIGGVQSKDGLGIPVSRIETIADQTINLGRVGYLAEYDTTKIERYRLNKGDILFSHINSPLHLGKTAMFDGGFTLYHGINLLRIVVWQEVMLPQVFNYYCKLARFQGAFAMRAQHAVNQSSINQKTLATFEIPVAPLPEQKRIADKLDSVLARVDACRERLDRIPVLLKRFRQSILAAATSGQLTEDWRGFHGYKLSAWREEVFGRLILEMKNGLSPKPSGQPPGARILRISAVRPRKIDFDDHRYLDCDAATRKQYELLKDDLLFTRYNGSLEFVGVCARVAEMRGDYVYPDKLIRVRVNRQLITPEFVEVAFGSYAVRKRVEELIKSSAGQKGISGSDLKGTKLVVPTIDEQHEIVRRVETLFAFADRLEVRCTAARKQVGQLTLALLAKAFRGELVPQDPADEPAAELLKRIAATRSDAPKPRRGGKAGS